MSDERTSSVAQIIKTSGDVVNNVKDKSVPAETRFVFTWTCGDQNTPLASSVNFHLGYCGYYA